jgi:hypothetical protein
MANLLLAGVFIWLNSLVENSRLGTSCIELGKSSVGFNNPLLGFNKPFIFSNRFFVELMNLFVGLNKAVVFRFFKYNKKQEIRRCSRSA